MRAYVNKSAKFLRQEYFVDFARFHFKWLRELVAAYKERGIYPVYPTQIIEYYPDERDKIVAIFSVFVMSWNNDKELEQIASMRELIGDHPWQWFEKREFVTLSVGRNQDKHINGYKYGLYWKIAKVYDLLWDECHQGNSVHIPSEVLTPKRFDKFCEKIEKVCELQHMDWKKSIVELVLMTDDGIGRDLWHPRRRVPRCPYSLAMAKYMKIWFPDWGTYLWKWDEAVKLFALEKPYDFFYAWLAHQELAKFNPLGCKQYATRYKSRWDYGLQSSSHDWLYGRSRQPEIKFE